MMEDAAIAGLAGYRGGVRPSFGVGTLGADVPINLVQRWLGPSDQERWIGEKLQPERMP